MGYPPIEELLPKSGNSIYKLVRLASSRAMELADGKRKLIEVPSETKTATIALEEIRNGNVVAKEVAAEFEPKEGTARIITDEEEEKQEDKEPSEKEEPELTTK